MRQKKEKKERKASHIKSSQRYMGMQPSKKKKDEDEEERSTHDMVLGNV